MTALAWSEAIKATIETIAGDDTLIGLSTYTLLALMTAVAVLVALGRLVLRVGEMWRPSGRPNTASGVTGWASEPNSSGRGPGAHGRSRGHAWC